MMEQWHRVLTVGLVLSLLPLGGCNGFRELSAELGEISRLQSQLQQQTGQAAVSVDLNNGRYLNVSFINSPLAKIAPDQKKTKALQVARLAYNAWPKRGELASVTVIFQTNYDVGPLHYSDSRDNFEFPISELATNGASTPDQTAGSAP